MFVLSLKKIFYTCVPTKKLPNHMLKEKRDGEIIKTKYIKWNKNKAA